LSFSFEAVANFTSKDFNLADSPQLKAKGGSVLAAFPGNQMSVRATPPDPNMTTVKVKEAR